MRQIFLTEGHPETGTLDRREILGQAFQLLMIHQIGFARTHIRVVQRLMDTQRIGFLPFAIFVILTTLGNFTNIDFRIEIGRKSLVMVTGIAIDNIQILDLIEMMFGCISCINTRYSRIKSTTQDGRQASLFETLFVGPLPAILVFSLIQRLIIGRIQIADTIFQTRIHDMQVLIRQCQVHHQIRLERLEQSHQLIHIVCIHLSGFDRYILNVSSNLVALALRTTGHHNIRESVGIHGNLLHCHRAHTTGTNN